MTLTLKDKEEYSLGSLSVRALHTPCHTRGHVLFFVTPSGSRTGEAPGTTAPLLFSGDTLFVGGCGRFFEGDASQSKTLTENRRMIVPLNKSYPPEFYPKYIGFDCDPYPYGIEPRAIPRLAYSAPRQARRSCMRYSESIASPDIVRF